jgi:hypothetical protein
MFDTVESNHVICISVIFFINRVKRIRFFLKKLLIFLNFFTGSISNKTKQKKKSVPAHSPSSDPSSHREKTVARRSRLLPHARPDPTSVRRGRHGSDRPDGGEVRLPFPTVRVRRTPPLRLPLGALLTGQLATL